MSPEEELEGRLAALPVAGFDALAEERMLARVRRAGPGQPAWLSRKVRLWQAAAACVLVGVCVHFGTRASFAVRDAPARTQAPRVAPASEPVRPVRVVTDLFAKSGRQASVDVSRWSFRTH